MRLADVAWAGAGAATGLVGFNLLMILGVRHAEPAVLGSAVACIPLVLAIVAPLGAGRLPSGRIVAGGAVVSVGAMLVTGWGRTDAVGILCAAGLIACEAAFTLCAARAVARTGVFAYTAGTCAVAAAAFGVLSAVTERPAIDARIVEPILYLGVAVTAAAFVLWFTAIDRLGADGAGLCAGIAAPASVLTAAFLGAALPSPTVWAGIALIAAGLIVGFGRPSRSVAIRPQNGRWGPLKPTPPEAEARADPKMRRSVRIGEALPRRPS
ncbi:DMT family transporter [Microbacterium sp. ASV49]|uniref:DMT family transporter n=1 Tax=Microbacterium candidum TaxID=3041922 RepID=A0ABT7MTW3_9MICO|nr:DMT family transporter [Microbacterium sp. ASV49]MDL9977892.1 DMT family transporter [Microbacterium sp. ASV49]